MDKLAQHLINDGLQYLPGAKCFVSGQYTIGDTGIERTCVEGKRFPPTPKRGQWYTLVDPTQHEADPT